MIQVSFSYDPETNVVSNVTAVGAGVKASAPKTAKSKKTKSASANEVVLSGSSLKLNQEVLDLLGVKVGDRVCIRFNPHPILVRPDISGETNGGNLITKTMTVSVRGKTGETIAALGDTFTYDLESEGFLNLKSTAQETEQEDKPLEQEICTTTLDESDILSAIEDGEEIDFSFDIQ